MSTNAVVIVSAYGRGHWMAASFARLGIATTLVDVSDKIGSWVPEEVEGPFGFFQDENLDESQVERLLEDDSSQEVKNGFTIWLKSGPLELKGPMTAHRLKQLEIPQTVRDYILNPTSDLRKKIRNATFAETWMAQFSHAYASNSFSPNSESIESSRPARLFANFSIRRTSRQGNMKSLDWCRRLGVKIIDKSIVKDVSMKDRRYIRGIEYQEDQSEKSQHLECDQLVWCLSSEETGMMSERLKEIFYPNGVLEPEWSWTRFRLKISEGQIREELPLHFILMEDLGKPWTHDNFIILQKTDSSEYFDAWLKLPMVQRFNKSYLSLRGAELTSAVMSRLVNLKVEIATYPLGYELTYNQIGPSRQPIYEDKVKSKWTAAHFKNVSMDSVEQRDGLGLQYQILHQKKIVGDIDQWWKKVLAKKNKGQEKVGE